MWYFRSSSPPWPNTALRYFSTIWKAINFLHFLGCRIREQTKAIIKHSFGVWVFLGTGDELNYIWDFAKNISTHGAHHNKFLPQWENARHLGVFPTQEKRVLDNYGDGLAKWSPESDELQIQYSWQCFQLWVSILTHSTYSQRPKLLTLLIAAQWE